MSKTFTLADNFIGKDDKERLESYGGHTIAHGRATRWHFTKKANGDDVFELFIGGQDEKLAAQVYRDRSQDVFIAEDGSGSLIVSGKLKQVLAELEVYFSCLHGEQN